MSLIKAHLPCVSCGSSDALSVYNDHTYCFSCKDYILEKPEAVRADQYTYQYLPWRGISKSTMEFYDVKTRVASDGKPIAIRFPYGAEAAKLRSLSEKKFWAEGKMSDAAVFGAGKFDAGSARAITITEGELDALSTFQLLGSKYPTISVRGSSSARRDCTTARDYINSFEKIYICFDNDEPGKKATTEVASLFDFNKVYRVKLNPELKDANGYLQAKKEAEFTRAWWGSKRFLPEGIISSFTEFDSIIDSDVNRPSIALPFPTLQQMSYGLRTGEVVLFTALEGVGKTEIIRAIEYELLTATDKNLGIIHLEESKSRMVKGLAGYKLALPCHLPDANVSNEEIKRAYREVVKRDERLHIYSHFGSDDPAVILDTIRFLVAACGCKYIFLDHITMVVSGLHGDDERRTLDYISTRLAMMVEELDFCLILVSHVNDEGLTRGSRNISKVANLWVHLNRNIVAETEEERNITKLLVKKNRFGSKTGPAGVLIFNPATFLLKEQTNELPF